MNFCPETISLLIFYIMLLTIFGKNQIHFPRPTFKIFFFFFFTYLRCEASSIHQKTLNVNNRCIPEQNCSFMLTHLCCPCNIEMWRCWQMKHLLSCKSSFAHSTFIPQTVASGHCGARWPSHYFNTILPPE